MNAAVNLVVDDTIFADIVCRIVQGRGGSSCHGKGDFIMILIVFDARRRNLRGPINFLGEKGDSVAF